jgi:superfamily I DNA and/or RNA helicase
MIGDQNQLPAVITQEQESCEITDKDLNHLDINNFQLSLFERLFLRCKNKGWNQAYGMLRTHYRLHKDISALIDKLYNNLLLTGKDEQSFDFNIFSRESDNEIEKLLSKSRLIFIESAYERMSKANLCEASIVSKLLDTIKQIYGKDFNDKTVGVVTPWRAQIALIKKNITDNSIRENVSIDTVERFQGSEREIIINSYAVHSIQQLNNLESFNAEGIDRKLLVSISRGSKQLIILGNRKVLENGKYYKEIINHIKRNGIILSQKERKTVFGV